MLNGLRPFPNKVQAGLKEQHQDKNCLLCAIMLFCKICLLTTFLNLGKTDLLIYFCSLEFFVFLLHSDPSGNETQLHYFASWFQPAALSKLHAFVQSSWDRIPTSRAASAGEMGCIHSLESARCRGSVDYFCFYPLETQSIGNRVPQKY